MLTHGLEQVPLDTVLLLAEQEEPVYDAPVTWPEDAEAVPVLEDPMDEPEAEPVQTEPVEEPEEEPVQEESADEPEEEPVPEESADEPEEEPVPEEAPVQEIPTDEPEEELVQKAPAEEPEEAPVPEAPAAPAKVPIDLSKLPELPVRRSLPVFTWPLPFFTFCEKGALTFCAPVFWMLPA